MILRTTPIQAARATRRAFTLLEVLVVVAIIVMLAGIGGYFIIQRYEDAKISFAKTRARDIEAKIGTYYVNNGVYPQNGIQDLVVTQPNGMQPLLPQEAVLDPWGKPFQVTLEQDAQGTDRVIVFTVSPRGQRISNLAGQ